MTSISPPTLLATFSNNHASSSKLPHVTLSPVSNGNGTLAVAAVQGDGIWTYDLNTLRPTTSFTVAPSTIFASKALSYIPTPLSDKAKSKQKANGDDGMEVDSAEKAVPQRVTLVAVLSGDKIRQDQQGKVTWAWKGEEGGERQEIILPHTVHTLLYTSMTSYPVVCIGRLGEITLLDRDLQLISTPLSSAPSLQATLIQAHIFSGRSNLVKLILLSSAGRICTIEVKSMLEEIKAEVIKSEWIDGVERKAGTLVAADISEQGYLVALDSENHVISRNIKDSISTVSTTYPQLVHTSSPPTIISLPTTSRPLCLLPTAHPELSLLLATASPALPAILSASPLSLAASGGTITHLSLLSRPSPSTTLIGLVVAYSSGDDTGRSVLYTSEITTPEKGIGMNLLLGSQKITNQYFTSKDSTAVSADSPEETILRDIEGILRTSGLFTDVVTKAEEAWKTWLASHLHKDDKDGYKLPKSFVARLLGLVFVVGLIEEVKEDVKVIKRSGPYAGAIIKDLVQRGWVTDDLYPGGVVESGLIPANDWNTLNIVVPQMPTLGPRALISLIKTTITPINPLVGQTGKTIGLANTLLQILRLPPPAPAWRVELRRHLSAEDTLKVLEVFAGLLEVHAENKQGMNGWDRGEVPLKHDNIPELESLIQHTSLLLDAHLPSLIPLDQAQITLERISNCLEPLISTLDTYRALRAPIEGVLTLAKRDERRRKALAEKRAAQRPATAGGNGNGAKGGNANSKARAAANGNFRGDPAEVMVGQWRVEDIVF